MLALRIIRRQEWGGPDFWAALWLCLRDRTRAAFQSFSCPFNALLEETLMEQNRRTLIAALVAAS
ncbi:MAG: hypothetical protein Q7T78_20195, partial [Rhodoferax sp.]|nr:hypothetical protein [Rhodoferax sp.]